MNSLSSNFSDFLNLLMTQLQNQDPTSPMDTNQFTTELVQFSSVEQQINTNTSLTQLIQLTQGGEVMQASAMTGKQVTVTSDHMPLQNGTGTIQFTTPAAAACGNRDLQRQRREAGRRDADVGRRAQTRGPGTARTMPAMPWRTAAYKVAVVGGNADGTTSALPFSVVGTATGVLSQSTGMQLRTRRAGGGLQQGAVSGELSESPIVRAPCASTPDGLAP